MGVGKIFFEGELIVDFARGAIMVKVHFANAET